MHIFSDTEALDCPEDFRELNFELSSFTVPGNRRPYPMYEITSDGFAAIAKHFTGPWSGKKKRAFNEAFYQMEENLNKEETPMTKDIVTIKEGKAITTSLKVAETFGKRHDDVLKAIRNLDCPEDFRGRNFALTVTTIQAGPVQRTSPMYEITRKGFTLLAMGFNGKKAMQFKIAYIEEFDRMEAFIEE